MASVARYCCCGVECLSFPDGCINCSTHYLLDSTTSGITTPADCYDRGDGSSIKIETGSVNGVANLAVDVTNKCRNSSGLGSLIVREYPFSSSCVDPNALNQAVISVIRTSTTWICKITGNAESGYILFYNEQPAVFDQCDVVPVFSNDFAVGDLGSTHGATGLIVMGYGGTATVLCRPIT